MKRYVTGCKHFGDLVLDAEYNSFVSQSDNIIKRYLYCAPKISFTVYSLQLTESP